MALTDNHGREITYLRLAVTDRCNLRCTYCMPAEGPGWLPRKELMSYEEMLRLSSVLLTMGIRKVRITGGEPFIRKDLMPFLADLSALPGLEELTITTNGVLTAPHVPALKSLGVPSVNLSLDTTDRNRFFAITRRDELPAVLQTMDALMRHDIAVKLNAVVMDGKNTGDILPLAALTRDLPVSVRFIEEMPFNGTGLYDPNRYWDHTRIYETLRQGFPGIRKLPSAPGATSVNYTIPGHTGQVGIIAAYTRSFCGTCNRIRVTPQGGLKTCLYDGGTVNVKDPIRAGCSDAALGEILTAAVRGKARDGWEAEGSGRNTVHQSMATIGG